METKRLYAMLSKHACEGSSDGPNELMDDREEGEGGGGRKDGWMERRNTLCLPSRAATISVFCIKQKRQITSKSTNVRNERNKLCTLGVGGGAEHQGPSRATVGSLKTQAPAD